MKCSRHCFKLNCVFLQPSSSSSFDSSLKTDQSDPDSKWPDVPPVLNQNEDRKRNKYLRKDYLKVRPRSDSYLMTWISATCVGVLVLIWWSVMISFPFLEIAMSTFFDVVFTDLAYKMKQTQNKTRENLLKSWEKTICLLCSDSTSVRVLVKTPAWMTTARWVWATSCQESKDNNYKKKTGNTFRWFDKHCLCRRATATLTSAPLWQCLDSSHDQVTHKCNVVISFYAFWLTVFISTEINWSMLLPSHMYKEIPPLACCQLMPMSITSHIKHNNFDLINADIHNIFVFAFIVGWCHHPLLRKRRRFWGIEFNSNQQSLTRCNMITDRILFKCSWWAGTVKTTITF